MKTVKQFFNDLLDKCPVCGKPFASRGMKLHILRIAEREVNTDEENTPHYNYLMKTH